MTESRIKKLYKEWGTPPHVIEHCEKVAYVADKIAEYYPDIDRENLIFACLLHDVLRIIDFNAGEKYKEKQLEIQKTYPGMNHSQAAYVLFMKMEEPVIAKIIKKHAFDAIIEEENKPFTLEEKIMTYADKRVLHVDIVSLKKRFEDGKKRYNPENKDPERQERIYKAYYQLEKELFSSISLNPEDIK